MPGIVAIYRPWPTEQLSAALSRCERLMRHSPDYVSRRFVTDGMALLRIGPPTTNSLEVAHDPAAGVVACLDGEIYDLEEYGLCRSAQDKAPSPAEAMLSAYVQYGEDIFRRIEGAFSTAIYHAARHRLTVVTDRFGLRPLYWRRFSDGFMLSSELKVLLCRGFDQLDPVGIAQFLTLGHMLEDRTLLADIKVLEPAAIYHVDGSMIRHRRYWKFHIEGDPRMSRREHLEYLDETLKTAVRRRLNGGRLGLFLSGGFDSRLVLGAMEHCDNGLHTFTLGSPRCLDIYCARALSRRMHTSHHTMLLEPSYLADLAAWGVWLTEGMAACNHFHCLPALPIVSRHADVILDGIGAADQLLGGSVAGTDLDDTSGYEDMVSRLCTVFDVASLAQLVRPTFSRDLSEEVGASIIAAIERGGQNSIAGGAEYFFMSERTRRFALTGQTLSLAYLESRKPLFDTAFVEAVCKIPRAWRRGYALYRELIVTKYPHLAAIPVQRSGVPVRAGRYCHLVGRIMLRLLEALESWGMQASLVSRAPAHYDRWMRGPLRSMVYDLILSDRALSRGYYEPEFVRRLVEEHTIGSRNHSARLGCLMTLELFCRLFLDCEDVPRGKGF